MMRIYFEIKKIIKEKNYIKIIITLLNKTPFRDVWFQCYFFLSSVQSQSEWMNEIHGFLIRKKHGRRFRKIKKEINKIIKQWFKFEM